MVRLSTAMEKLQIQFEDKKQEAIEKVVCIIPTLASCYSVQLRLLRLFHRPEVPLRGRGQWCLKNHILTFSEDLSLARS